MRHKRGPRLLRGTGISTGHHGELFQGATKDGQGQLRRCLMTLPCERLYSRVTLIGNNGYDLVVQPPYKHKTLKAVKATLEWLEQPSIGGVIQVVSNIDEGKGYGSSTADCVAAVIATSRAFGAHIPEKEIAKIVVGAEVASDNVMFSNAVLFAHREGQVLEDYGTPLPPMEVIGIDTQPNKAVDTLRHAPPSYFWNDIQTFEILLAGLRRAIQTQDAALLGRVATASAEINEQFLPKPAFKELCSLATRTGALGIASAHSGTLLSILLDANDAYLDRKVEALRDGASDLGFTKTFRFRVSKPL
jgi:uncharacterized protein involved in propanediol utilization